MPSYLKAKKDFNMKLQADRYHLDREDCAITSTLTLKKKIVA